MTGLAPQRTRPADRRLTILEAAADLFGERGYDSVGMTDIANVVDVRPSALYRHFQGKEALLDEIFERSLDELETVLNGPEVTIASGLRELAEYAVDNRRVSTLVGRELTHVSEASQLRIRTRLDQISALVADRIATAPVRTRAVDPLPSLSDEEARLLAEAVLAVLQSIAFFRPKLTREELCDELVFLVKRVASAIFDQDLTALPDARVRSPLLPASRREALLARAVSLFAESSYARVTVEDVGASLEMAGPSVYSHFSSKSDILVTALERGAAHLSMLAADVLLVADSVAEALRLLLARYCSFAFDHPALIDLMLSETRALPADSKTIVVESARMYVGELIHLLRQINPGLTVPAAHVQVQAALMIPNNLARSSGLRRRGGIAAVVSDLCLQSLDRG